MTADDNLSRNFWTPQDIAVAAGIFQRLFVDVHGDDGPAPARTAVLQAIAQKLNRTPVGVWQRFRDNGPSFNAGGSARKVSAQALALRAARKEAEYARDITASVFGDPPPGFSALDRKRSREAAR
jgi:hypothetical protein